MYIMIFVLFNCSAPHFLRLTLKIMEPQNNNNLKLPFKPLSAPKKHGVKIEVNN